LQPRISIVSICFNNLEDLKLTCAKIEAQSLLPYEHIIVDGSTNEEILNWLQTAPQPSWRKWIHERDKGISDAFNKGIRMANGDVIHLQNSGDYYYDDKALEDVSKAFSEKPDIRWLHGKYAQFRGGVWLIVGKPFDPDKLYRGMRTIGHPTMFVRRELYDRYGLFSLDKKIAMDYDFLVRIADEPFYFMDRPLVCFTPGGISDNKIKAGLLEVQESYRRYRGGDIRLTLWGLRIRLLKSLTQTSIGKLLFGLKNRNQKIDSGGM
jgi:glycosyltransferase involved in cell wall biosynthesis